MKPNWQQQQEMARRQQELMRKQQEQMRKQQEQIRQNQIKAAWYLEQQRKRNKPLEPPQNIPGLKIDAGGVCGNHAPRTGIVGSAVSSPADWPAGSYQRAQPGSQEDEHTSVLAIAALVAAVIGLVIPFVPIVAVILGLIARFQIDESDGTLSGAGISTAAVVLGVVEIGICGIIVILGIIL
jgi:thiol:disulfide interchange protein